MVSNDFVSGICLKHGPEYNPEAYFVQALMKKENYFEVLNLS